MFDHMLESTSEKKKKDVKSFFVALGLHLLIIGVIVGASAWPSRPWPTPTC
jgi:hypothetical protein